MTEWGDDVNLHWSVEEFLDSVGVPDPDGSKRASRLIEDEMDLTSKPAWYERFESERCDCPNCRAKHWFVNRHVVLAVVAGVALWLALWAVLKP